MNAGAEGVDLNWLCDQPLWIALLSHLPPPVATENRLPTWAHVLDHHRYRPGIPLHDREGAAAQSDEPELPLQ